MNLVEQSQFLGHIQGKLRTDKNIFYIVASVLTIHWMSRRTLQIHSEGLGLLPHSCRVIKVVKKEISVQEMRKGK